MNIIKPVKLAILGTRGIPAHYGGFETFAEELALRLVALGIDVTVYCEAGEQPQLKDYQGVQLEYISASKCGPLTTVLFDLRCLWHARKGNDVVYMLGYGASLFCLIPRIWGIKVWLNVDGIEWARAKWSAPAKVYFKVMEFFSTWVPHKIIADARGIKEHLEVRHKVVRPCSVIPYGAPVIDKTPDARPLSEWGLRKSEYYLVVARLEPENHVKEIIEGFIAADTKIPLIIVGNHKIVSAYAKSLVELENERVRFIGGVYKKEKLQALRFHSLAYFHGHSVGGTNPSLLEAMGCGNLVIVHDNVFNREVCGEIGRYFQAPEDIPEIIREIEDLPFGSVESLRQAARQRVREKYDWDDIARTYYELLTNEVEEEMACKKEF